MKRMINLKDQRLWVLFSANLNITTLSESEVLQEFNKIKQAHLPICLFGRKEKDRAKTQVKKKKDPSELKEREV